LAAREWVSSTVDLWLDRRVRGGPDGRTDARILGKKIEKQEIILISLALLIHPLVILTPTGWSMLAPYALSSLGNNGNHGFSEVLYAFSSGAADMAPPLPASTRIQPGSTWRLASSSSSARIPLIFLMAVAVRSRASRPTPVTTSTLRTDTVVFGVFWFATILIVGALTFFPVLVLGPIANSSP